MQRVVFYDDGTDPDAEPGFDEGEIVFISEFEDSDGPTEIAARQPDYTGYLVDATGEVKSATHYVDTSGTPSIEDRPVITDERDFEIANDGTDEVRISLPAGTVTTFDFDGDDSTNVSAEDFVFTTTILGEWSFSFDPPFPHAPVIIEIASNASL
jgi:hypothetical protein